MKCLSCIAKGLSPAAWTAVCLLGVSTLTIVGCTEKTVEQAPVDVEQERREHMEMMQRETGQKPAPETK